MGHVHVHSAEERNVYYLDQLCTVGFCAALGVVQILLYRYGVLDIILAKKFHVAVLWSGIVLTALAGIALLAAFCFWWTLRGDSPATAKPASARAEL